MSIIEFFEKGQSPMQVFLFVVVFVICWNLEFLYGVSENYNKKKHYLNNALFIIPGAIMQGLLGLGFAKLLHYENLNGIGLLPYFNIDETWKQAVITFIFLDFCYWLYHFLMHKLDFAWRFHAVHHSDKVLNVFTSLREHPGETFIRLSHYILASCLLGTPFWMITLHSFIQVISKIIVHSNWRLPDNVDKYLSYLILTPNMHHVHHHEVQPYTDSNYGDLFSVWDRMFGTFQYLPKHEVVFGLDVDHFEDTDNLKFKNLIKVPFSKSNLSND